MNWELDGNAAAVAHALAGGAPLRVGWFRFYFEPQRWEWSDEVHRMHGYQPGEVELTTEIVLSHKHPDDRAQVEDVINDMIDRRVAFSTRHRIVDTCGADKSVVVVGDLFCDDTGDVVGTHGFYVDVTPASPADVEDEITAKVTAITERRSSIEQTKGMLMLIYDINETSAFNILKSLSQVHNVKLGRLAKQISDDFCAINRESLGSQGLFDQLLFSAPQRVVDPVGP